MDSMSMASSHAAGADLSHFDSALLARLLGQNSLREAAAAATVSSHCCRGGGSGNDYFTENVTLSSISSNIANPIASGVTGGGGECGGASGSATTNKDEKAESYQWKKYGHKFLPSQNAKRFYYHCAERDTTGCPAKLIIDKVPKKKTKHGRRAELKDLVAAREVPGSGARRPPIDGAAVVGADRESGSPRYAVAGRGEKGEDAEDFDFGWEENREILDALPVLERRVDRTLTPRRFCPAAEVGLTARLAFSRGARVSSTRGDSADAAARAFADASALRAAAEGFNASGGAACGKAEEGFETLWSYVEANLRHRVASQAAAAAAAAASAAAPLAVASQVASAAAAAAAAAPFGVASQVVADSAAGPHGLVMNGCKSFQHRQAVASLLGLAAAQQEEAPQQAEGAAQESIVLHTGMSCPVLPPLSRFEEIQALYLQGLLGGQGLVASGGEGVGGEMEGRRVCGDEGKPGLREAGGGGESVVAVAPLAVEMDLIGQLGEGTALRGQAGGHGAPQVLSTELCL
ncbi:unnamed protein product [Closterium sp. Yama58-4]|nr:unnamed protein product [Closterium sp. Yama58-4]